MKLIHTVLAALLLATLAVRRGVENPLPPASCNLRLTAPVSDWFEGIPIGNGQYGALIWGGGQEIIVRPSRLDLWDERFNADVPAADFTYAHLQKAVASGTSGNFRGCTRGAMQIGTGRLHITLPQGRSARRFDLDLGKAEASVELDDNSRILAMAPHGQAVLVLRLPCRPAEVRLSGPGLKPAEPKSVGDHPCEWWYQQQIPAGTDYGFVTTNGQVPAWSFLVYARLAETPDGALIVMTITSSKTDGADLLAAARARAAQAIERGYDALAAAHRKQWAAFWNHSAVQVPDAGLMRQYYLNRYYLGAGNTPGNPAHATLQGLWIADGPFPPFRNNLHNDLESQAQYMAYQTAGDFAEGRVFLDYLWDRLPVWRRYAARFFGTAGAMVPSCCSLAGNPTGGWPQVWTSPTYPGWFGWLFYQHWRYTKDQDFLRDRAYPWCREIAECWRGLLKPGPDGTLLLPLSTSAEIFNDSPRAWLKPNSTQDRDLMAVHLLATAEMADALGKSAEAAQWRKMAGAVGPVHIGPDQALMYGAGEPVAGSHRHFSHVMGIWPFSFMTVDGSERDRAVIAATMKAFDRDGESAWLGFSWPWMSAIRARTGDAEQAWRHLDLFVRGFVSRNGFDMNSDINGVVGKAKKSGYFTLEANVLAQQALHEMLIQSWAHGTGSGEPGVIRLFPATPWEWHEASFQDLRAEGGFRVSAKRQNNATVWFKIVADADGVLKLRDNFGGRTPKWRGLDMTKAGTHFERAMRHGEVVEATLLTPAELPPKPGNVYAPLASNKEPQP
ncbi:MAG: glycoside hydrolase family 95-like protein [bacterium]